jgi:hypothetical protein
VAQTQFLFQASVTLASQITKFTGCAATISRFVHAGFLLLAHMHFERRQCSRGACKLLMPRRIFSGAAMGPEIGT